MLFASFDDIDVKGGGPPMGGLPKGEALKKWGESKGIRVLDMRESKFLYLPLPLPSADDPVSRGIGKEEQA
jgi:hypothetical protein